MVRIDASFETRFKVRIMARFKVMIETRFKVRIMARFKVRRIKARLGPTNV